MPSAPRCCVLEHAAPLWGGLLLMSGCATLFVKSFWAPTLVAALGLPDAGRLWMLAGLDASAFVALPAGMALDSAGPGVAAPVAAACAVAGYGLLALAADGGAAAWVLVPAVVLCGQSSIWSVMAALHVGGRNFAKEDKGLALGLLMTFFGLSSLVVTMLLDVALGREARGTPRWIFGVGAVAAALCLSVWPCLYVVRVGAGAVIVGLPPSCNARSAGMHAGLLVAVALVACAAALALAGEQAAGALAHVVAVATAAAVAAAFIGGLAARHSTTDGGLCGLRKAEERAAEVARAASSLLTRQVSSPIVLDAAELQSLLQVEGLDEQEQSLRLDGVMHKATEIVASSLTDALGEARYWLLYAQFAFLVGCGMLVSNSLNHVGGGAGTETLALIFCIGNAVSRLGMGWLSDKLIDTVRRDAWLAAALAVMATGHALIAAGDARSGVFLVSAAFGTPWLLVPAVEQEWYGLQNFGKIHAVMMTACVAGVGLVLSFQLAQGAVAAAQGAAPATLTTPAIACAVACAALAAAAACAAGRC